MGEVWRLIEDHQARAAYPPSMTDIATAAGIKKTTLAGWQDLRRLPTAEHLRAVARQIGVPYPRLLEAALVDTGYLDRLPVASFGEGEVMTPEPRGERPTRRPASE